MLLPSFKAASPSGCSFCAGLLDVRIAISRALREVRFAQVPTVAVRVDDFHPIPFPNRKNQPRDLNIVLATPMALRAHIPCAFSRSPVAVPVPISWAPISYNPFVVGAINYGPLVACPLRRDFVDDDRPRFFLVG